MEYTRKPVSAILNELIDTLTGYGLENAGDFVFGKVNGSAVTISLGHKEYESVVGGITVTVVTNGAVVLDKYINFANVWADSDDYICPVISRIFNGYAEWTNNGPTKAETDKLGFVVKSLLDVFA